MSIGSLSLPRNQAKLAAAFINHCHVGETYDELTNKVLEEGIWADCKRDIQRLQPDGQPAPFNSSSYTIPPRNREGARRIAVKSDNSGKIELRQINKDKYWGVCPNHAVYNRPDDCALRRATMWINFSGVEMKEHEI